MGLTQVILDMTLTFSVHVLVLTIEIMFQVKAGFSFKNIFHIMISVQTN